PLATPWRRRLAETLRSAGRGAMDRPAMHRVRATLIGIELAGSLVLLVGCGMMIRSVRQMVTTDLGFRVESLTRARVLLPTRAYPDAASRAAFLHRVAERVPTAVGAQVALTSW